MEDGIENYQRKEASGHNGTAGTCKLHTEGFPDEECLGQHLHPRISGFPDTRGDLPTQSTGEFASWTLVPPPPTHSSPQHPPQASPCSLIHYACGWRRFFALSLHPVTVTFAGCLVRRGRKARLQLGFGAVFQEQFCAAGAASWARVE